MQGKDTKKSTFNQLFKSVFHFSSSFKNKEVDKYVKKFTALKFILLMSFAQLKQLRSLREISSNLEHEQLSQSIGLDSISFSQISRKQKAELMETVQSLFGEVIQQAGIKQGFHRVRQKLGRLYLIDSTIISLCLTQYRWAKFRKTKSGIKLHIRLRFLDNDVLPDTAIMTNAQKADRRQMDDLIVEDSDAFYVFDRAYVDYEKFDHYCRENIRFASRLKSNALVETIAEYPVSPNSQIIRDCKVLLGKPGLTQMENLLRLIETKDSEDKPIVIVTNDFTLASEEIGEIYRYRWQIELFFKWIKQHLHIKHFYGIGQQAVELQLLIALITYCLLILIKQQTGYQGSLLEVKRCLLVCLYEPFPSFVRKLHGKKKRSSKGRRRIDHENIYQETLRQVIAKEADHLDDLDYDPIIL